MNKAMAATMLATAYLGPHRIDGKYFDFDDIEGRGKFRKVARQKRAKKKRK